MNFERKLSFLLVDDSRVDLKMFSKLLELSGVASSVATFISSTEALAFFKRARFGEEKMPEVLIVDLQMPELNGFQLLDEIMALGPSLMASTRTLMLSSSLAPSDHQLALEHPLIEVLLQKPLNIEQLKTILAGPAISTDLKVPIRRESR